MKNRAILDLAQHIEWLSTGYDHFRHVYEFTHALYVALETQTIDYDKRERMSINKNNLSAYANELTRILSVLQTNTNNNAIHISASVTYPGFEATTSIQRELAEIIAHHDHHYHYISPSTTIDTRPTVEPYTITNETQISLEPITKIKTDINHDKARYIHILAQHIQFPSDVYETYSNIAQKIAYLDEYRYNHSIEINGMQSSVSNEYYKIEEELVHLLYDMRLFIKNTDTVLFQQLTQQDPAFGIARSTIVAVE